MNTTANRAQTLNRVVTYTTKSTNPFAINTILELWAEYSVTFEANHPTVDLTDRIEAFIYHNPAA